MDMLLRFLACATRGDLILLYVHILLLILLIGQKQNYVVWLGFIFYYGSLWTQLWVLFASAWHQFNREYVFLIFFSTRDKYITVQFNNIEKDNAAAKFQYEKCVACNTFNSSYDCMSIMHYRDNAFASPAGSATMTAKDTSSCDLKSTQSEVSPSDKEILNLAYRCNEKRDRVSLGSIRILFRSWIPGKYKDSVWIPGNWNVIWLQVEYLMKYMIN